MTRKVESKLAGLAGPFTRIAQAMSRHWNVRVIADGLRCCTDGDAIYIPFTSDYLDPSKRQVLHGLLDHEVAHVAEEREHKDAGRPTPLQLMRTVENRTVGLLFNAFEDIRIEVKYSKQFPGVSENLAAANRNAVELFQARHGKDGLNNFWHSIACAIILASRGLDISWLPEKWQPYFDLCAEELSESTRTSWGEDSLALARSVYEKLKETAEKAKEKAKEKSEGAGEGDDASEPGESDESADDSDKGDEGESADEGDEDSKGAGADKGDEDEDGEGETGGAGEDEDKSEDGDEGETGGAGEDEGDEDSEGEGSKGEDKSEDSEGDAFAAGAEDVASEASEDDAIALVRDASETDATRDAVDHRRYVPDPLQSKKDYWVKPAGSLADYQACREEMRTQIGALRSKQIAYLQTITRRRLVGGLDEGFVDPTSLASVRAGRRNVFCEHTKVRALDTAIMLLVDLSGSMGHSSVKHCGAYYAKRTAIALAESWEPLDLSYEIMGFQNDWSRWDDRHSTRGCVSRAPFRFSQFKGFGDPLARCRERFSDMNGGGDNADGEAVWVAAQRLAARPERRKILVVLSDGWPAHQRIDHYMLQNHLRDVVTRISRAGIDVFGIGAGTDAPKAFYNKSTGASHIVVTDLQQLASVVFLAMRARIFQAVAA